MDSEGPRASGLAGLTPKPRRSGFLILKWELLEGKEKEWVASSGIPISGRV